MERHNYASVRMRKMRYTVVFVCVSVCVECYSCMLKDQ